MSKHDRFTKVPTNRELKTIYEKLHKEVQYIDKTRNSLIDKQHQIIFLIFVQSLLGRKRLR